MIEAYCRKYIATVSKESGAPLPSPNLSDMSGF